MIYLVHIEPINKRYSKQWLDDWKNYVDGVIGSEEIQEIYDGEFLDVIGTNKFKLEQGIKICDMIKEGKITNNDTLLFLDLWNPVVTNVAYIRSCLDMKFKIVGYLHAGTWDKNDFLFKKELHQWCRGLEFSMGMVADEIIVATKYHKKLIQKVFPFKHIIVDKFPIFLDNHKPKKKEDIIVFPHRLAAEKQPDMFDYVKKLYNNKYPNKIKWVKTAEKCKSKDEYYELLAKSKISLSFAQQETFGIAMLESMNLGCIPLSPNRLSYKETIDIAYRYETLPGLVEMIHSYMESYIQPTPYDVTNFEHTARRLKLKYT